MIEDPPGALGAATPSTQAAPVRREQFPCFDGLRALAALSVVLFHIGELSPPHQRTVVSVLARMDNGVPVFFVISGFLLYRPFLSAHLGERRGPRLGGYARRRALRIYPAYWVALVATVYVFGQGVLPGLSGKLEHGALVQTYFAWPRGTALPQAWTLVVEVSFYAALPLYAASIGWLARRFRPFPVELAGVVALLVGGTILELFVSWGATPPIWVRILPLYAPMFAWGMLLAVTHSWLAGRPRPPTALRWIGRHPEVPWAFGVGCFVALVRIVGLQAPLALDHGQIAALFVLGGLLGFGLVTPAVIGPQHEGLVRRGLRARPLVFLGTVSYGIYIWHVTVLTDLQSRLGLHGTGGFLALGAVGVAATIAVATISWYAVERPLIRLAHRPARRDTHTSSR